MEPAPEPQIHGIHAGRRVFVAVQGKEHNISRLFKPWGLVLCLGCKGEGGLPALPSPFVHFFFSLIQAVLIGSESRESKGNGASFKIRPVRSPYLQLDFIRRAGKPYPTL